MNDCGNNCECVHIEPFRTITKIITVRKTMRSKQL